jgi:glycosyltransferase involved in cell wall biosynthesis
LVENTQKILILMAIYNGEKFLAEQLESFIAQTDGNWDLLVSDDGSSEQTAVILNRFKDKVKTKHNVNIVSGPRSGSAMNFLSLIGRVPDSINLVALSDQDDVWLPEKLAKARKKLGAILQKDRPIMYSAGSIICDEELVFKASSSAFKRLPSFRNALVQSIGGGNTMMLNGPAIRLLQATAKEVTELVVHDWWIYQIISGCGGTVLRDADCVLHYRQHANNLIGANNSWRGKYQRLFFIFDRRFVRWNDKNIAALKASRHRFTPETKKALSYYVASRHGSIIKRLVALYRSGAMRQRRSETLALYVACAVGKL